MISESRLKALNCVKGIDVSSYQDNVDWKEAYKDGILFAFVKLTEGIKGYDGLNYPAGNSLMQRCEEIEHQEIKLGYYHFGRPGAMPSPQANATAEVNNILVRISNLPKPVFPLVLDLEEYSRSNCWQNSVIKANLMVYIQTFINQLKNANYDTTLYVSPAFVNDQFMDSHNFGQYPLWIANYLNPEVREPVMPKGYKYNQWSIWQYGMEEGVIPGCKGDIDLDIMKCDFFEKYS